MIGRTNAGGGDTLTLRNQIADLNSQITQKDQTITNLNSQITQKDQTITNLNSQITQKNNQIDELEKQLLAGSIQVYSYTEAMSGDIFIACTYQHGTHAFYPQFDHTQLAGNNVEVNGITLIKDADMRTSEYFMNVRAYSVSKKGHCSGGFILPNLASSVASNKITIGINDNVKIGDLVFLYYWNDDGYAYYPLFDNKNDDTGYFSTISRVINRVGDNFNLLYNRLTAYKMTANASFTGGLSIHLS